MAIAPPPIVSSQALDDPHQSPPEGCRDRVNHRPAHLRPARWRDGWERGRGMDQGTLA